MTSTQEIPAITLENCTIGYRTKKREVIIKQDLNFEINKGTLVGVLGSNGSGKTTLLKTLTAALKPFSGHVKLQGVSLENYAAKQRATKISYVSARQHNMGNHTVLEWVAMGRYPYTSRFGQLSKIDNEKINDALTQTHTIQWAQKPCYTLSDGQLQRVYVARALAQDTPIIVLDEPTTYLDLYQRVSLFKLIKELVTTTKKTIVIATHEIELAVTYCDQLLMLTPNNYQFGSAKALQSKGILQTLFPPETKPL